MGDDIEQLADLVYTDKREKPSNLVLNNEIKAYLKMDQEETKAREKCRALSCRALRCRCSKGRGRPCNCTCTERSGNTKLAK